MLWMINHSLKAPFVSKLLSLLKKSKKGSFSGVLFFVILSLSSPCNADLSLAILDTGFCPNLIKLPKNITLMPVEDVTQSAKYKCLSRDQLSSRQFHGQWVLEELLHGLDISKTKLTITPMVIFDKNGRQKLSYWQKAIALAHSKKVDLVVVAAGLPLKREDTKALEKAAKMNTHDLLILAAGARVSKGVSKTDLLFPQDLLSKSNLVLFGSYHKALDASGPASLHFKDTSLIRPKNIDYFVPYNFKPRLFGELKGTSLSLAKGAHLFLKTCHSQPKLKDCLKALPHQQISLKNKDQKTTVKALNFAGMTTK